MTKNKGAFTIDMGLLKLIFLATERIAKKMRRRLALWIEMLPPQLKLRFESNADLLHVSRPHLIKLLETGQIAYTKVGSHRRVTMQDVLAYLSKASRFEQLKFTNRQAGNSKTLKDRRFIDLFG